MKILQRKYYVVMLLVLCMTLFFSIPTFAKVEYEKIPALKLRNSKLTLYVGDEYQLSLLKKGETYEEWNKGSISAYWVHLKGKPNSEEEKRYPITWKSSNKSIATVDGRGLVKAKRKGSVEITAKVDKKTYTCKLTVKSDKKQTVDYYISKSHKFNLKRIKPYSKSKIMFGSKKLGCTDPFGEEYETSYLLWGAELGDRYEVQVRLGVGEGDYYSETGRVGISGFYSNQQLVCRIYDKLSKKKEHVPVNVIIKKSNSSYYKIVSYTNKSTGIRKDSLKRIGEEPPIGHKFEVTWVVGGVEITVPYKVVDSDTFHGR